MQIYKFYAARANFIRIQVFSYLNKLESTKPILKKKLPAESFNQATVLSLALCKRKLMFFKSL